MYPADIAVALRAGAHDVIAVQEEPTLRRLSDPDLFAEASQMGRAVVTENVADWVDLAALLPHTEDAWWCLVFTSNKSLPRHREGFIRALVRALGRLLDEYPGRGPAAAIHWLTNIAPDEPPRDDAA